MTAEQTYEYRLIDGEGEEWDSFGGDLNRAEFHYDRQSDRNPDEGPFRIQRRLVTPWEDVPDGE